MTVYDEFAERTNWAPGQKLQQWINKRYLDILKDKISNFEKLNSILEIGAGRGDFANAVLNNSTLTYLGVEPSNALREIAEGKNPQGSFHNLSLPNVSQFMSGGEDMVILIHTLEHAGNGYEARLWLKDAIKCVRPGGYIIVISPEILAFREYFWDIDWSHCFPTSLRNIKQLGVELGMSHHFGGYMNLGGVTRFRKILAKILNIVIPTKFLDRALYPFFNRNVATGLKVALIWDVCIVILSAPNE